MGHASQSYPHSHGVYRSYLLVDVSGAAGLPLVQGVENSAVERLARGGWRDRWGYCYLLIRVVPRRVGIRGLFRQEHRPFGDMGGGGLQVRKQGVWWGRDNMTGM